MDGLFSTISQGQLSSAYTHKLIEDTLYFLADNNEDMEQRKKIEAIIEQTRTDKENKAEQQQISCRILIDVTKELLLPQYLSSMNELVQQFKLKYLE